jgi:protein-disulfide isomerase
MSRLTLVLTLLVGLLAGGFGVLWLRPAPATVDEGQIRQIVTSALAETAPATASALDPSAVEGIVEEFLLRDPSILERMSDRLVASREVAAREGLKRTIEDNRAGIYETRFDVVLGNPDGDVTLVEWFDYNCGYCRNSLPDLATLLAEDPNLKVILKEFPILTEGSLAAAKVAMQVGLDPELDYWAFHQKLFATRGQIGAEQAIAVAESIGASRPPKPSTPPETSPCVSTSGAPRPT